MMGFVGVYLDVHAYDYKSNNCLLNKFNRYTYKKIGEDDIRRKVGSVITEIGNQKRSQMN